MAQELIALFAGNLDITNSLKQASVWLPHPYAGEDGWIKGSFPDVARQLAKLPKPDRKLPVLVFLTGSTERGLGDFVAQHIAQPLGLALINLNSHAIDGRPRYISPAPRSVYDQVHALRQAEIDYFLEHIEALESIDQSRMILMGVSEGAVAATAHPDPRFALRVVVSWSMEAGYFVANPTLGGNGDTVFLNIIGEQDEYFGAQAPFAKSQDAQGHGGALLAGRSGSRVVVLPGFGHRVLEESDQALTEIKAFIAAWLTMPKVASPVGGRTDA